MSDHDTPLPGETPAQLLAAAHDEMKSVSGAARHLPTRRSVGLGLLAAPALCGPLRRAFASEHTSFPFSVASGDPSASGVVLWTRLARSAFDPEPISHNPIQVEWVIAKDWDLVHVVQSGLALARPALGFSVHVHVQGLQAAQTYHYGFYLGGERSPVGRTKTLASPDQNPASAQFSVVSCQNWENGYFDAYRGIVEDDPDFVLHLGDYIYDVTRGGGVRRHEMSRLPMTLAEYRARHALYRTDPALIAAHESLPFVLLPDNHDALEQDSRDPAQLARRAAAYQAWYEFLPVRHPAQPPSMRIYRGMDLGRLVRLNLLDTRQFRGDETICKDHSDPRFGFGVYEQACPAAADARRTMLGWSQETWLTGRLRHVPARWNVIGSTVMMSPINMRHDNDVYRYLGSWDGYDANRRRILDTLQRYRTPNPVVLSGDLHSTLISRVVRRAGDDPRSGVMPEFLGTSISSLWPEPLAAPIRNALPDNPHVQHYDSLHRGYLRCTFTPTRMWVETRLISHTDKPGGKVRTADRFVVENGSPEILVA
ncbi:alkaline phosphatase [Gluconacetobacter azotocaptans]|uniref:Alkaline phosphatase n=1 Tax=Gluconacetobacter azotocaptans TaxID=142834 RepID=A0A7W4JQV1_9PROT|nr:alkaline phosphatase D family protein [Gluconacetobacter azotocaptans]MBB2189244.1 alkaline phosphatase [Gluconacetobacter azotocaptans]